MQYYATNLKSGYQNNYVIWCGDDIDHLYVIDGYIPIFQSPREIVSFAKNHKMELVMPPFVLNIDRVRAWCASPSKKIDCVLFLNTWNMLGDIAATYEGLYESFEFKTEKYLSEYRKLFAGNNIKVMRGNNPKYYPKWDNEEIKNIKAIMDYGFSLFKKKCRKYNDV
jgi:hypothetical protein